jgi:AmmeMemoRadiSam system protein A
MAPSSCIDLSPAIQSRLLGVARVSIATGLATRQPLEPAQDEIPDAPESRHGNFVTLMQAGELRGCMGDLTGRAPLTQDIATTAFKAAFQDPRFGPLRAAELEYTHIEISVLSVPEPVYADSPGELLGQLRPHVHGLIVVDQNRRGTLLPKVWEQLPDPRQFVAHVMLKAGLRPDHWSETLRFFTYESLSFAEPAE